MLHTKNHYRSNKPVIGALTGFPKGLCDNCLSEVVGKTRNDAITPARRLLGPNTASRKSGTCERCQNYRELTQLPRPRNVSENASGKAIVNLRDFDSLWQEASAYLDKLDGANAKEDFASRIQSLRKSRKISPTFAALLTTCLTYRHEIRFHSFESSPEEENFLRLLLDFVGTQLGDISNDESPFPLT